MTRTLLIMYLALTMGVGPRVCCVAGDMADAGTKILVAAQTHRKCCAKPMTPSNKSGQPNHVPGRCHNLQRDGIEAAKTIPPTNTDFAIVAVVKCSSEVVAAALVNNAFPHPEARDKLSLLQILRC